MLKRLAKLAADRSGAIELVRRLNQNRVRILMYHRFPRQHERSFDRQCAYLAANYNVISLQDAAERLARHEALADAVVVTVDDGYADMFDVAFPILKKHKLPATLFVTTGFVNRTNWMPGDRVRYHFAHTSENVVGLTSDAGVRTTYDPKCRHAGHQLRELLKRVPNQTKERMLSEMDGDVPVPHGESLPPEYRPCTWDQLRTMADGGVTIGAHTVTHPILSRLEEVDEAEREIVMSKDEIECRLDRPVEVFAYPNGLREDISQESVECVRSHFKAAVTALHGLNGPGADAHELFRLACDPEVPLAQMARLLAGPVRLSRAPRAALSLATS